MKIKVDSIGIANSKSIKLGEGLITIGSVLTIVGILVLRSKSQWCTLNNMSDIDDALELYKKHL